MLWAYDGTRHGSGRSSDLIVHAPYLLLIIVADRAVGLALRVPSDGGHARRGKQYAVASVQARNASVH